MLRRFANNLIPNFCLLLALSFFSFDSTACQAHGARGDRSHSIGKASKQKKIKIMKEARRGKMKSQRMAKSSRKKLRRVASRPARVRIIDTGRVVTPERFPIPDVDEINSNLLSNAESPSPSANKNLEEGL